MEKKLRSHENEQILELSDGPMGVVCDLMQQVPFIEEVDNN